MNANKRSRFAKLKLSGKEWQYLNDARTNSDIRQLLTQEAWKFYEQFCDNAVLQEEEGTERYCLNFEIPPPLERFYALLAQRFGLEVSTFFVRFVITPRLLSEPDSIITKTIIHNKKIKRPYKR